MADLRDVNFEPQWYVKLTYFRENGKFYSDGSYISKKKHLYEIWEEVAAMNAEGRLPGLVDGAKYPLISVKVPQHPHKHPKILVTLNW